MHYFGVDADRSWFKAQAVAESNLNRGARSFVRAVAPKVNQWRHKEALGYVARIESIQSRIRPTGR
jgi:hypothetical protein